MKVIFQPSSDSWQGSSFFWKVFSSKNHGHILFWKTPEIQYSHFFLTSSKLELDRPRPFQTGKNQHPQKSLTTTTPPKKLGRKPKQLPSPETNQLRLSSCFGHLLLRQLGIFTGLQGLNGAKGRGMSFTPKTPTIINPGGWICGSVNYEYIIIYLLTTVFWGNSFLVGIFPIINGNLVNLRIFFGKVRLDRFGHWFFEMKDGWISGDRANQKTQVAHLLLTIGSFRMENGEFWLIFLLASTIQSLHDETCMHPTFTWLHISNQLES